jgi:hypothetical protein
MKITISKDEEWNIASFAKAPLELLLCDDLLPTTKLLWIVLANQANFRPIDRAVLDRRIGIHRSTRLRGMAELKEAGLISGTDSHIVVHNPIPILASLEKEDTRSREIAKVELGIDLVPAPEIAKKQGKGPVDYLEAARISWNSYRPANYSKVRRMSSHILKAIDLHIRALGVKSHDYDNFFSILKAGIEKSDFWAKANNNKSLQSIVGTGQPTSQKYQNVYSLYNDGLEYGAAVPTDETKRSDDLVLSSKLRNIIDTYDELHYSYSKIWRVSGNLDSLTDRIIETEEKFKEAGLDPARFRMKYQFDSWPTDVPAPEVSRERFWRYDDEL